MSTLLGNIRWRLLVGVRVRVGGVLPGVAILLGGVAILLGRVAILLGGVGGYSGLGRISGPTSLGLPWRAGIDASP